MHYKHTDDCKNTAYSFHMLPVGFKLNLSMTGAISLHSILSFITHFATFLND